MGGSGGVSGEVRFPPHIEDAHQEWIKGERTGYRLSVGATQASTTGVDYSLLDAVEDLLVLDRSKNPFKQMTFSDPSADAASILTGGYQAVTSVTGLLYDTDWESAVDGVIAKVEEAGKLTPLDIAQVITNNLGESNTLFDAALAKAVGMGTSQATTDLIASFSETLEIQKAEAIRQLELAHSSVDSAVGSALVFGRSIIEAKFLQEVSNFGKQIVQSQYLEGFKGYISSYLEGLRLKMQTLLQEEIQRLNFIQAGITTQLTQQTSNFSVRLEALKTQGELARLKYLLLSEYEGSVLDKNLRENTWELFVFEKTMNILAAPAGMASALPEKPSRLAAALGGALGGIAAGGKAAGTGGAIAGGLLGGLGGAVQ